MEPSFHQSTSIPHTLPNEGADHSASPARNSPPVHLGDKSALAPVSQADASTSLLEVMSCSGRLTRDTHVPIQRSSSPTSDGPTTPLLPHTPEPTASQADQLPSSTDQDALPSAPRDSHPNDLPPTPTSTSKKVRHTLQGTSTSIHAYIPC